MSGGRIHSTDERFDVLPDDPDPTTDTDAPDRQIAAAQMLAQGLGMDIERDGGFGD